MEMDIIRIKTEPNGQRMGISVSSQFEETQTPSFADQLANNLFSEQFELLDVETIPDGDYPMTFFKRINVAASIIPEGEPIPISTAKPVLCYLNNKKI